MVGRISILIGLTFKSVCTAKGDYLNLTRVSDIQVDVIKPTKWNLEQNCFRKYLRLLRYLKMAKLPKLTKSVNDIKITKIPNILRYLRLLIYLRLLRYLVS